MIEILANILSLLAGIAIGIVAGSFISHHEARTRQSYLTKNQGQKGQ